MLKDKKVFILGMARSGFEAARLIASNNEVLVTDMKEQNPEQLKTLEELGVKIVITDNPVSLLDDSFDMMIKNPGIKYSHPAVLKARELGLEVINEVELAGRYMADGVNIIGVTGSNGKTTTVTLIHKFLSAEHDNVFLGGNIGTPLCNFVSNIKSGGYLVMEISDHQLCDMYQFKTNVSVMTNIYDAHADFHDSHERYVEIKKRIFNNHTASDINIVNYDNQEAMDASAKAVGTTKYFSKSDKQTAYIDADAIYYNNEPVVKLADIKLKGMHNYENIMTAICAAKEYDVKNETIVNILRDFGGVEHRIEYVDSINDILYYNDSKATNCESTKTALKSFNQPTLLILGGLDRGHSFDDLIPYMTHVKYIACYGETKHRIKEFADKNGYSCEVFENLTQATIACNKNAVSGDVVLLSPACASWDQYKDFETRGNEFKSVVKSFH